MRFIFTGPECSGKSTLTKLCFEKWGGVVVWEYAREYLERLNREYNFFDLEIIGLRQIEQEEEISKKNPYVWCDTDYMTVAIWSLEKYKWEHVEVRKKWLKHLSSDRHYFLCKPDFPWEFDPLREHPEQRHELFEKYKTELKALNLPYTIVHGSIEKRMEIIENIFRNYFPIMD